MKVSPLAMAFLAALQLFGQSVGQPITNVFVDSLGDRPGASELREKLVSELEKSHRFHVVANQPEAQTVLTGTAEVWVKAHVSLNPRNRTINGDTEALYAGYLSIELRDKAGDTLWSYLATPHSSASPDVARDLAALAVKKLLSAPVPATAIPSGAIPATTLIAAGATFPYPVYAKWFDAFHKRFPAIEIRYDAVGSETGMKRLMAGSIDFAGSDIMISPDEFFAGGKPKFLRFPAIMGAVVPVYNLPDATAKDLRFTPEILAGIYLAKITKWNDPAIRAVNRTAVLPDRDIEVVHRSDGSGSSYVFTDYLSKVSPEWKAAAGASGTPKWPAGKGAEGNEGVARLVRETPGSIGYVEYIYAITEHMSYGSVRNSAGRFVSPDLESILAAARDSSNRIAEDFQTSITNAPAADAYPIASFTWFVVPAQIADSQKKTALKEFLQWMLGPGQNQAAALGYVSIAPEVLLREQRMLERF